MHAPDSCDDRATTEGCERIANDPSGYVGTSNAALRMRIVNALDNSNTRTDSLWAECLPMRPIRLRSRVLSIQRVLCYGRERRWFPDAPPTNRELQMLPRSGRVRPTGDII